MSFLKTAHPLALRLLMTDDVYSVPDMVKEALVTPLEKAPAAGKDSEAISFNYAGENNKYILILVNDPVHTIINPTDLTALTAILAAKSLEIRDVAIVNLHKHADSTFKHMKEFFSCSKLVLLGINPKDIGLPEINSNTITEAQETKILASFSINEMIDNIPKKKLFWNEMKKL